MSEVLEQVQRWNEQGDRIALATVISTWGSSPRPVGSQLAINEQGAFEGSVSGGCVEGAVVERAQGIIAGDDPTIMQFSVSDEQALDVGLTCGGSLQVLVAPVPDEALLLELCGHVANRVPVCLVTHMESGRVVLVTREGVTGDVDITAQTKEAALSMLMAGECSVVSDSQAGDLFVHCFAPPPRLLVIGAAHIAQILAPMARMAGFDVSVIDPRTAFATPERFPSVNLSTLWPDEFVTQAPLDVSTAVVTLAHDAKIDDPALEAALRSDAFYVGALGSRKTHEKRTTRLLDRGFSDQDIARIHAPVGLNLGGRKSSEIAVSIVAQIVEVWNNRARD